MGYKQEQAEEMRIQFLEARQAQLLTQNSMLLENQIRLLNGLIDATERLNLFRRELVGRTQDELRRNHAGS